MHRRHIYRLMHSVANNSAVISKHTSSWSFRLVRLFILTPFSYYPKFPKRKKKIYKHICGTSNQIFFLVDCCEVLTLAKQSGLTVQVSLLTFLRLIKC